MSQRINRVVPRILAIRPRPGSRLSWAIALGVVLLTGCHLGNPAGSDRLLDEVQIETGDFERFLELARGGATDARCAPFEAYLEEATPALRSFLEAEGGSDPCSAFVANAERYRNLLAEADELLREAAGLPLILERWRTIHPRAPLPDIHVVVGTGTRRSAIVDEGIVIAAEALDSPAGLAPETSRALAHAAERYRPSFRVTIPGLTVRESHLTRAVKEGNADFVAMLLTGRLPAPELHAWARSRESEIWAQFEPIVEARPRDGWFEAGGEPDGEPPGDPGRFLGYRMAEAVWSRTADRSLAIRELLAISNFSDHLERSGYRGFGPSEGAPPSLRGFGLPTWPGFDCTLVRADDAFLQACVSGNGAVPVVLVPPAELDHRRWHAVAPDLARVTTTVVYDRSGNGDPADEATSPSAAREAHELAWLLEVVAGPGPYLLAGEGEGTDVLSEFARLYPWRTAGTLRLDSPSEPGESRPHAMVEAVAGSVSRIASATPLSPGTAGEPLGCWRAEGPGLSGGFAPGGAAPPPQGLAPAAATQAAQGLVRLALAPGGADATVDRHPLLAAPGGQLGSWEPHGSDRIRIQGRRAEAEGFLDRGADGSWRGSLEGGAVTFRPYPCELPD